KNAFSVNSNDGLQKELNDLISTITNAGMNPEDSPKVKEIREKLSSSSNNESTENEIYSYLTNFFSRYYKDGDFVSLRRYKKDTYAIPYEGEEVKLHWANSDQYYIKTSENFRDYTFKTKTHTVHFKLQEAQTSTNNNKSDKRVFVYQNHEELDGELYIYFTYEDGKNHSFPNDIEAQKYSLDELKPTKANPKRTLLDKHLTDYTAKNSFDYFIHKDLKGFLTRELDFFIKNEILYIDDILEVSSSQIENSLNKIKTFKTIANKIIAFLSQLEEFQKKLWLKKKFVIDTNYCITLDRVDEKYYEEILNNGEQLKEWKELFDVQVKSIEDLKNDKYLVLDTKFFDVNFKDKLLSEFDDIDEECDGVLINSENFGALNLLQERYKEQIKTVYIDPPYNTGKDGFLYNDSYQHSSWMSFIYDRLALVHNLMNSKSVIFSSIDDFESKNLLEIQNQVFGNQNFLLPFFIQVRFENKTLSEDSDYQKVIEQVFVHAKDTSKFKPIREKEEYTIDKFEWEITELSTGEEVQLSGKKVVIFKENEYTIKKIEPSYSGLKETWATGSLVRQKGSSGEFFELNLAPRKSIDGLSCLYKVSGIGEDGLGYRYFTGPKQESASKGKFYSGIPLQTLEKLKLGIATKDKPIPSFFNFSGDFGNCRLEGKVDIKGGKKPEKLIQKLINFSSNSKDLVIDFFAGSGTTPSVSHKMDKKYIAVEMGEYFNTKVLKRMKYTLFGNSGGIISQKNGGLFKYFKLESYEDCLNNLAFKNTDRGLFDDNVKEDYLLNYMLDYETNKSLLNIDAFKTPFCYKLKIATSSAGETVETNVDLVETFNYLIGLKVKTRVMNKGFLVIQGENLKEEKILVIWRDGKSNDELNAFFSKMDFTVYDREFDTIYVNGDNNLANLKKDEDHFKVKLIEEEFKARMFGE
ncbi:MAG: site-specific DNA-methyltransferase, partial [Aliarcobacter sp.]|nr:site-specific DNA-methyltransferase [Aliarcobacter sp.]